MNGGIKFHMFRIVYNFIHILRGFRLLLFCIIVWECWNMRREAQPSNFSIAVQRMKFSSG